ncbi:IS3 family transposase [Loigolactobacillus coryniformis]
MELGNLDRYQNSQELIESIENWIMYYNRDRIQIKLDGKSPINYRKLAA